MILQLIHGLAATPTFRGVIILLGVMAVVWVLLLVELERELQEDAERNRETGWP